MKLLQKICMKNFWNDKKDLHIKWIFIKDSEYYDTTTKKALKKVKDEASGKKFTNFVLRSELYSHLVLDDDHDGSNEKLFK